MRRLRRAVTIVVALLVLAVASIWAASYHPAVQAWARDRVVRLLRSATGADFSLGHLGGSLGRTIVLEDVRFASGPALRVRARRVDVHYSLAALIRGTLVLEHVAVDGLRVRAVQTASDAASQHAVLPVSIDDLAITDGRVALFRDGTRLEARDVALTAAVSLHPDHQDVRVTSLTLLPRRLGVGAVWAAGDIAAADGAVTLSDAWIASRRSRVACSGTFGPDGLIDAHVEPNPLAARDLRDVLPAGWRPNAIGTLAVSGTWPRARVIAGLDLGDAGRIAADGSIDLGGGAPRYAATFDLATVDAGGLIAGAVTTRAAGRARVRGRGARVAYHLALAPSEIGGQALARSWLAGTTGRGITRTHGIVATTTGRASVRARLALGTAPPRYRAEAKVDVAKLDALVAGVPGSIAGRVRVRGRGLDPETGGALLDAMVDRGVVSGVTLSSGILRAAKSGTRVDIAELRLASPGGQASVTGTLDVASRVADLAVDATGDLAALGAPVAGSLAIAGHVRGTPTAPSIDAVATAETERGKVHAVVRLAGARGTLDELTLAPTGAPAWQLARPAPLVLDDGVRLGGAVLVSGTQRLTLTGRVATRGPLDATAQIDRLQLGPLLALLDRPDVDGEASGQIRLGGTAAAPRAEATITVAGLGVGETRYGNLDLRATLADRMAELHAALHHPDAGVLNVDGTIPVTSRNAGLPVAVTVHADRLDLSVLRVLSPTQIRDLRGHVSADVRLTGPIGSLRADGQLALDDGRIELKATGAAYEDVHLHLRAAGTRVEVTELRARGGDGTLTGTGAVDANGGLDLSVRLERFMLLRQVAVEAALDGTLAVRGTLTEPELRGDVEIARARIRPSALPATGSVRKPDPTIEVTGLPPAPPQAPSVTAAIGEALALDVRVRLGRNTIIERSDANIELGGALHIEKTTQQQPAMRGEVRLVRGWYAFAGKRFTIDRGVVTFGGETPPKPRLDVTASHRATDYRVEAHVEGDVDKPTLTLSSDPPLEQADILAVLLFGKPTRQLGSGESLDLQQHAIGLAATYASPKLVGSVTSALGIDRLDVTTAQGGDKTGAVRVGRYVVEDVFVSLAQEFGARAGQVVGVEYNLGRSVSVRASTSSRGDSGIDLFWRRRY